MSSWLLCDDYGRFKAAPKRLAASVFWAHPNIIQNSPRISANLRELQAAELIVCYIHSGEEYAEVTGWDRHQRMDNAGKPRHPGPSDLGSEVQFEDQSCSAPIRTQEALDSQEKKKPSLSQSGARMFLSEYLEWFNRRFDRKFSVRDELVGWTLKLMSKGFVLRDFKVVALHKHTEWRDEDGMDKHFRPATLLRPNNFERYIDPAREWHEKGTGEEFASSDYASRSSEGGNETVFSKLVAEGNGD
jgi:uncharacterized phage protein (TIGR02220 family)